MVVSKFKDQTNTKRLLEEVSVAKSSYYYKETQGRRGRKPLGYTLKVSGEKVIDKEVVSEIKTLLLQEFVNYGYIKVSKYLKNIGYIINKKKVYRLMKENNLLLGKRIRTRGTREFVKLRIVYPSKPYEHLQMDIKYFYLNSEKRNVYLLTLIDVFSKKVINYKLSKSIKKKEVLHLLYHSQNTLLSSKNINLRTDNGSQFLAHKVRDYLKQLGVNHEFTHVSSPEENCYIEAFHSILESEIEKRFELETFDQLDRMLNRYMTFYNEERLHGSIDYKSPNNYLSDYYEQVQSSDLKVKI